MSELSQAHVGSGLAMTVSGPVPVAQLGRIAANAAAGRVNNAAPTRSLERQQLGNCETMIIERAIVEIDERVHAQLANDAGMHGL